METYGCESSYEEATNFRMLSGGCGMSQAEVGQQETFQYQQLCTYHPSGNPSSDDALYKSHPNDFNNNNNNNSHHHQHQHNQLEYQTLHQQQYNQQTLSPQQHQQSVQQVCTGNMHFMHDTNNYCFSDEQHQHQHHPTSDYLHTCHALNEQHQYEQQHYSNESNYDSGPILQEPPSRCNSDSQWQSPTSSSSYYESSGSCHQQPQPHPQQMTDLQATSDTYLQHSSTYNSQHLANQQQQQENQQTFYQHEQQFNHQHPQSSQLPCYASLDRLNQTCDAYNESSHVVSTTNEFSTTTSTPNTNNATVANVTCAPLTIHHSSQKSHPLKSRRGRPRKKSIRSKTDKVNGKLWEFIRDLLLSDRTNPSFIRWERREDGVFKFVQSDKVAKMWGERKQNPKMTYEKLSRAMRYYYKSKVLLPVFGRRLVYKFGPNATGWMPEVAEDIY